MGGEKKVESWDEEVTDKPALKVSSWDEETTDTPLKKKEPTTASPEVTTSESKIVSEPQLESGVKDNEPIDLPKEYESANPSSYKSLIAGQRYKLRRGGVSVTGTWDEANQQFIKDPLLDFAPKEKPRGLLESAVESVIPVPNLENEEEVISRNLSTAEKASEEVAKKDTEIKQVAKIPLLQQLNQLKQTGASEEEIKKLENTPLNVKDIPSIRFQKGSEGQVLQNLQTNLPTEEYKGELMNVPLSKLLPEDYKGVKTVGELYNRVNEDSQELEAAQQQLSQFDKIVKDKQIENLPQEQKDYLKSLEGSPLYDEELVKTLEQSGTTENIVKATGIGLAHKLDNIYKLGSNIGLSDVEMANKMKQELAHDKLFGIQPKGIPAEVASSVGGMIPDLAAGLATGGTGMMASMLSTMPNNLLKEYYADKFAKGETPKVADAWKYVASSMAIQAPMIYGAGKLGSLGTDIVGKTTLKRAGELLTQVAKKAGTDATVFGFLGTYGQNKINKAFDVAENDDYLHSAVVMGTIGALFGLKEGAGKVFKSKISEKTRNEIDYIASYLPDNLLRNDINKLVKEGKILPSEGDETLERMANYRVMRSQIPAEITFEQAEKIYPLWEQKQELQKRLKESTSEFKSVVSGQLEDVDRKILIKAAVPLTSAERLEKNILQTGEAENKQIDKARLRYLEQRDEAYKESKQEKKEIEKQNAEIPKPESVAEPVVEPIAEVKEEVIKPEINIFDKIEEAKRSKKTQKGKVEAMEKAMEEHGEQGKRAIEIETNFKSLVERLKSMNDENGEPLLKVKC